jgi:hypothetical protein
MVAALLLAEVANVLATHGQLHCSASLDVSDGTLRFEVTVARDADDATFDILNLREDLQRLVDLCQLRLFVLRYGIDEAALLPFVTKLGGE